MGGGSSGSMQSTTVTSNIPEYARPYVENMLGAAQQQIFTPDAQGQYTGFKPYTPYSTDPSKYFAAPTTAQNQAYGQAMGLTTPTQFDTATGLGGLAGMGQLGLTDTAGAYGQMGAGFGSQAANTAQLGFGSADKYENTVTNPDEFSRYMSPYTNQIIAPQLAQAQREYEMANNQQNLAAARQGTYGGARQALQQIEREKGLNMQKSNIIGQGLQNAYGAAQNAIQYGAGLGLQGLQTGYQGLGLGLQGAQLGLQGVGAQQQGLAGAANTAAIMGQLGAGQQGSDLARIQAMNSLGSAQQQYQQGIINQSVQDYATGQQYPYMQLGTMSSLLRGLPIQNMTTQQYMAQPSILQQGAGLLGAYGAAKGAFKKGGVVKYDVGGSVERKLDKMQEVDPTNKGLKGLAATTQSPELKRMIVSKIAESQPVRMAEGGKTRDASDVGRIVDMLERGDYRSLPDYVPKGILRDITPDKEDLVNVARLIKNGDVQGLLSYIPKTQQTVQEEPSSLGKALGYTPRGLINMSPSEIAGSVRGANIPSLEGVRPAPRATADTMTQRTTPPNLDAYNPQSAISYGTRPSARGSDFSLGEALKNLDFSMLQRDRSTPRASRTQSAPRMPQDIYTPSRGQSSGIPPSRLVRTQPDSFGVGDKQESPSAAIDRAIGVTPRTKPALAGTPLTQAPAPRASTTPSRPESGGRTAVSAGSSQSSSVATRSNPRVPSVGDVVPNTIDPLRQRVERLGETYKSMGVPVPGQGGPKQQALMSMLESQGERAGKQYDEDARLRKAMAFLEFGSTPFGPLRGALEGGKSYLSGEMQARMGQRQADLQRAQAMAGLEGQNVGAAQNMIASAQNALAGENALNAKMQMHQQKMQNARDIADSRNAATIRAAGIRSSTTGKPTDLARAYEINLNALGAQGHDVKDPVVQQKALVITRQQMTEVHQQRADTSETAVLHKAISEIEKQITSAGLMQQDPEQIAALNARKTQLEQRLAALMSQSGAQPIGLGAAVDTRSDPRRALDEINSPFPKTMQTPSGMGYYNPLTNRYEVPE